MNLVALPGQNVQTEDWLRMLTGKLTLGQQQTLIAHYRHWDDASEPDLDGEVQRAEVGADDLVVAKSFGTLVLLGICDRGDLPHYAVCIGTPLKGYPDASRAALQQLAQTTATLFIQQTADFTGSYAELEALVGDCGQTTMAEVAGHDHIYADTEELSLLINEWWRALHDG